MKQYTRRGAMQRGRKTQFVRRFEALPVLMFPLSKAVGLQILIIVFNLDLEQQCFNSLEGCFALYIENEEIVL